MTAINSVDLDLKRAFTELQVNKLETNKKLKMLEVQTEMQKKAKKNYEITDREIQSLGGGTRVFSSVGRMFVLSTPSNIHDELTKKQEKCDKAVKTYDDNRAVLLKTSKELEDNLRELVQQKKNAS